MKTTRTLAAMALGFALVPHTVQGQDRSRYRNFQLGSGLPAVSALARLTPSQAKIIHQWPVVMQELEWRPSYFVSGSTAPQDDPVKQIVFSFYNDQLSKIVVDYDRDRTAGMTVADMIAAISQTYGPPLTPGAEKTGPFTLAESESGTSVAWWGDADHSIVLYRSSELYGSSSASRFRLIVTAPRLEALARIAHAQAVRLDEREAPQREIARQKKEVEDTRVADEKARRANKAAFRP